MNAQNVTVEAQSIAAKHILQRDQRPAVKILNQLGRIYQSLENRWEAHQCYERFKLRPQSFRGEPLFVDEAGKLAPCSQALAPCEVVNDGLTRLVDITLRFYGEEQQNKFFKLVEAKPEFKKMTDALRQIAIHAEEAMEKEALGLIFKSVQQFPDSYVDLVRHMAAERVKLEPNTPPMTVLLKALAVDLPAWNQKREPERYPGLVFKYFDNYEYLVNSELKLLTQASQRENWKNKTFTFVGAGFPLTGILLHQKTGGKVKLVDCDGEAVANAKKFIELCEACGIVKENHLKVYHANALDLKFQPRQKLLGWKLPLRKRKEVVHTDILDLASAIPSAVTDAILKTKVHEKVLVRKRNVQGMSRLLYERYHLQAHTPYEVAAEVTTPQDALSRSDLSKVVAITHPENINSCELYVRKNLSGRQTQLLCPT